MTTMAGKSIWRERVLRIAPLILWTGVIFFLSSPAASMAHTSGFLSPILRYFWPDLSPDTDFFVNFVVRKLAHFTVYAILAMVAVWAFAGSRSSKWFGLRYALAPLVALLIASLDELNQSFEPSRTGLFSDVILDVASALVMTGALWWIKWPPKPIADQPDDVSSK